MNENYLEELKTLSGVGEPGRPMFSADYEPTAGCCFGMPTRDHERLTPWSKCGYVDIDEYCKDKSELARRILGWQKKILSAEDVKNYKNWVYMEDCPKEGDQVYIPADVELKGHAAVKAGIYHKYEKVRWTAGVPYEMPSDEVLLERMGVSPEDTQKVLDLVRIQKLAEQFKRVKGQENERAKVCSVEEQKRYDEYEERQEAREITWATN